jgi:hypothetical protein
MGRRKNLSDQGPACTKIPEQTRLGQKWDSTKDRLAAAISDLEGKDTSEIPEDLLALEKFLYDNRNKEDEPRAWGGLRLRSSSRDITLPIVEKWPVLFF